MRICYVLLSPTFGLHQYTAELTHHHGLQPPAGANVHLVTTQVYPADRYASAIPAHTPLRARNSGLSAHSLHLLQFRHTWQAIRQLQPDLVHVTGPHLWNVPLVLALKRAGLPVVHTIHDLEPHSGTSSLLHLWNRLTIASASHILVHGRRYQQQLLARGLPPGRVTTIPLLHLFLGHERRAQVQQWGLAGSPGRVAYDPVILFFGRFEPYKGIDDLLQAWQLLVAARQTGPFQLHLAGPGRLPAPWTPANLPPGVRLTNRLVNDDEALALFRRCSLVVLPYKDATQSALISAAYFFRKPVLVTRTGALPEYVVPEQTGFISPPNDPPALAETLLQAISRPGDLPAMGATGRAWYDLYTPQAQATLLALYQQFRRPGSQSFSLSASQPVR